MGKHREIPRPERWSTLQALQNAALPAAILIVVGVVVFVSPVLRPSEQPPVDGSFTSAETSETGSEGAEGLNRAGTDLAFKAGIVPATEFEKVGTGTGQGLGQATSSRPPAQIPEQFVKVPRASVLPTDFTVSSFNALGFGHTTPGGNKKGWADGHTRTRMMADLLRGHDVSVVGLQEFQNEQFNTFNSIAGGEYAVYPGGPDRQSVQNSIAWRRTDWALEEASTTPIPYFGGQPMPMPYILLRNLATGQRVWFANYHNPADAHGPAERHRDAATNIEIALFNQLRSETGLPVVVTGDMNERDEYLCRAATGAGMHSANGGYADSAGCHLPRPMQVDWILGTEEVTFSDYLALANRASDHPFVVAGASLPPQVTASDCIASTNDSTFIYCPPA